MPTTTTDRLQFTGDEAADRLLVSDPLALLIGFVLDQQVPLQKAFSGPLVLSERIGGLDAKTIATMDPDTLDTAFRTPPALHRFPSNMAKRTREMAAWLVERYDGEAARIWTEAKDGADLHRRLLEVPGFGPMKAGTLVAILGKRLGRAPAGWEAFVPDHMTLGDVDSPESLRQYQDWKKGMKAEAKAAAER
ncbi:MAG TPA: HhH-GPD-type base excision DNA repair protein [Patescibacteria group bacterium]|nr:HhH-GPD-type base excision DNA repair protein [Patescibacteria group bacterium]